MHYLLNDQTNILDTVEVADVFAMQIDHKCKTSSEARWSHLYLGRLGLSATGRYQKGPCKKLRPDDYFKTNNHQKFWSADDMQWSEVLTLLLQRCALRKFHVTLRWSKPAWSEYEG